MDRAKDDSVDAGRRDALKTIGTATLAATLGPASVVAASAGQAPAAKATPGGSPYNILFILTDQERYFRPGELPPRLSPAGARAAREERHRVREPPHQFVRMHAVAIGRLYGAAHPADEMFDNTNFPWIHEHVDRPSDGRRHAARSRLLHGLQGQVAPDEGVRDGQRARLADEDLHARRWRRTASPTTSASATSSRTTTAATCTTASSRRWP